MPFPGASFDAVLAQLVVDGLVDARQGVAEMCRIARPGGVVAACVWDWDGGIGFPSRAPASSKSCGGERV